MLKLTIQITSWLLFLSSGSSFLSPSSLITRQQTSFAATTTSTTKLQAATAANSLVVISPPGGVGEVAAVKAAELGSTVRWFVVSKNENTVVLSQEALDRISNAGGSVDLAGATVDSLVSSESSASSSLEAVKKWCGNADALVCCMDGIVDDRKRKSNNNDEADPTIPWKNAIKLAAKEAAKSISGTKIAIVSVMDDETNDDEESEQQKAGGFLGGLLGGSKLDIPSSLYAAMSPPNVMLLRYGQLFGIPESSPDFSPFVGGPRRDPELCMEYQMSAVRVDSTIAVSGTSMMGQSSGIQTSRHAIGQIAALLVNQQVSTTTAKDVCVSSQPGTGKGATVDEWKTEFERVERMMKSGQEALLFQTEFASVPDIRRLSDWLTTKWAPAVLRTYDIAAIRTGARPVYANQISDDTLEIVWQKLVNFESVTVGKMSITVTENGIQAVRTPGDAKAGFGTIPKKPLNGEDVLVRRLAEAASQAVEKGLAKKKSIPKPQPVKKVVKPEPAVVSSIQSSGTVTAPTAGAKPGTAAAAAAGPRQSGARRSTERERGTRRRKSPPPQE